MRGYNWQGRVRGGLVLLRGRTVAQVLERHNHLHKILPEGGGG